MDLDIYQDLICPWCFIGKRRLDRALAQRPDLRIGLRWRPFQLNPGMPREGMDRATYLTAKFGGEARARQVYAAITETAARDGLTFALDRIGRTPNTLDAHRLVDWAVAEGVSPTEIIDALYTAYFVEARDIGAVDTLADIAASRGLDRTRALAHLASQDGTDTVRAMDAQARRMGIRAVPCFVFDGRYALSGAQEPQAFLPLFDLAVAGVQMAAAR